MATETAIKVFVPAKDFFKSQAYYQALGFNLLE